MIKKTYWDEEETKVRSETHTNEKGKLHRVDGPSYQEWRENGQRWSKSWHQNGLHHHLDGPAYRKWLDNELEVCTTWDIFGIVVAYE